jgi:hypothetical protein
MNSKNVGGRTGNKKGLVILTLFTAVLLSVTASALLLSDEGVDGHTVDTGNFTLEYGIAGDEAIITGYLPGGSGDLIIPETVTVGDKTYPVTAIDEYAFMSCLGITGADMRYIKNIGNWAFSGCSELRYAYMDSLVNLSERAFYNCVSLYSVDLGTAETLGREAFKNTALFSITIPATVTTLERGMFTDCVSLKEVRIDSGNQNYIMDGDVMLNRSKTEIVLCLPSMAGSYVMPNTVTSVMDDAFRDCYELTSVVGDSLRSVGIWSFSSCYKLTSIDLSGVTDIGYSAFEHCTSLRSADIGSAVYIDSRAFGYSGLTTVEVSAVTLYLGFDSSYDGCAFGGSPDLMNINVAAGNPVLSSVDGVLFDKDKKVLISVPAGRTGSYDIPDGVKRISSSAFESNRLTSITIPDSVDYIDYWIFFDCVRMTEIKVSPGNNDYTSIDGVLFSKDETELIAYPKAKAGPYIIPSGVTSLGYNAFMDCIGITSVKFPETLMCWGDEFTGCINLAEIIVTGSFDRITIDGVLFTGDGKKLLLFPPGRTGGYDIPSSVETISYGAFGESRVGSVTIPSSVTSIETVTFYDNKELTRIDVSPDNENYMSIDGVLFTNDGKKLMAFPGGRTGSYVVPSFTEEIGYSAFDYSKLSELTIMSNVKSIGSMIFWSSDLKIMTAPEGLDLRLTMPATKVVRYNGDVVVMASIEGTTVTLKFMPENGEIIDDIVVKDVSGKTIQDRRSMNEWTFDIGTNNQVYVSATVRDAPEDIATFAGIAFVAGFVVLMVVFILIGARGKF